MENLRTQGRQEEHVYDQTILLTRQKFVSTHPCGILLNWLGHYGRFNAHGEVSVLPVIVRHEHAKLARAERA